jgi:hypothetical protein
MLTKRWPAVLIRDPLFETITSPVHFLSDDEHAHIS